MIKTLGWVVFLIAAIILLCIVFEAANMRRMIQRQVDEGGVK